MNLCIWLNILCLGANDVSAERRERGSSCASISTTLVIFVTMLIMLLRDIIEPRLMEKLSLAINNNNNGVDVNIENDEVPITLCLLWRVLLQASNAAQILLYSATPVCRPPCHCHLQNLEVESPG